MRLEEGWLKHCSATEMTDRLVGATRCLIGDA